MNPSPPLSPKFNYTPLPLEEWIKAQENPEEAFRMPKAQCECLCHSKKVTQIMLNSLEEKKQILEQTIARLEKNIQGTVTILNKLHGWDNAMLMASHILADAKKKKDLNSHLS